MSTVQPNSLFRKEQQHQLTVAHCIIV